MRICLLVEGSYPYIVGGVSSWIQMLITGMPEHEFIIYSIGPEEKFRGKFKYKVPDNVIEIKEIFLDSILKLDNRRDNYRLNENEKLLIMDLLNGQKQIDLHSLLNLFRKTGRKNFLDIFMSFDFFDVITAVYKQKFSYLPFTDFFWTVRSMLLPMFYLLQQDMPEADLFHSVAAGYCGIIGAIASTVYGKPFYLTEHGIYAREREEEIIKCEWAKGDFKSVWIEYFYQLAELNYHYADKVYTLFNNNAVIEAELGCDSSKIGIIPNGIHQEKFMEIPELAADKAEIVVGAVVRVVPIKDIMTMLRAFYFVEQRLSNVKFLIMGPCDEDKEYYQECIDMMETLALKNVEFTGTVKVLEYLPQVDIGVLTSLSEGQPLAILEGMAAGRPFVTTDVGCCRELIYGTDESDNKQAGFVAPVLDFMKLAEHIIYLAENSQERLEMGRNGRERINKYYTYDDFIAAYKKVYSQSHELIKGAE